jgi:hypothetical protein
MLKLKTIIGQNNLPKLDNNFEKIENNFIKDISETFKEKYLLIKNHNLINKIKKQNIDTISLNLNELETLIELNKN